MVITRRSCPALIIVAIVALCLLAGAPTLRAAPPGAELLREVDAFRARAGLAIGTWRGDGDVEVAIDEGAPADAAVTEALSALLAPGLPADEALTAGRLAACLLACVSLTDGVVAVSGGELDGEAVSLTFALEAPETLVYTVGAAVQPGDVALSFERDTYRPRAVTWISARGVPVRVEASGYDDDGWTLRRVRVRLGSVVREIALVR